MAIVPFRETIVRNSPGFLREGTGERMMYTFGVMVDCRLEKVNQGTKAHLPMVRNPNDRSLVLWVPPADCLDAIGRNVLILRGLTESDYSYGSRLRIALTSYRYAGTARGVLIQVLGYLLALTPEVRMVWAGWDRSTYPPTRLDTTWNSYPVGRPASAEPVTEIGTSGGNGDWDWDSLSQVTGSWGHWGAWLIIYSVAPNAWTAKAGKWGDGTKWGAGSAWGLSVSADVVRSIVIIVRQFKNAFSWVRNVIVCFDATLFDPTQPAGGGINPDGYFGHWSKVVSGVRVRSRFSEARYGGEVV